MNGSVHLSDDTKERWRAGCLTPAEILAASDHLVGCAGCAAALAQASSDATAAALASEFAAGQDELAHPSFEELERWVDAPDSVEAEIVSSHLEVCDACHAEAEDLRRFALTGRPAVIAGRPIWLAAAAVAGVAIGLVVYAAVTWKAPPPSKPRAQRASEPELVEAPVMILRDGDSSITLRADGSIDGVPAAWREEVAALLHGGELAVPAVALLVVQHAETQRGDLPVAPVELRLIGPLSRIVLDDRPRFGWRGPQNAEYRVEVFDSRFERVAASGRLTQPTWRPDGALPRGELLTWMLRVSSQGQEMTFPVPPHPPAVFEIATSTAAREIEAARSLGSHLVTGLAQWRAGLIEEAAAEFEAWSAQNPDSAAAERLATTSALEAAKLRRAGS